MRLCDTVAVISLQMFFFTIEKQRTHSGENYSQFTHSITSKHSLKYVEKKFKIIQNMKRSQCIKINGCHNGNETAQFMTK